MEDALPRAGNVEQGGEIKLQKDKVSLETKEESCLLLANAEEALQSVNRATSLKTCEGDDTIAMRTGYRQEEGSKSPRQSSVKPKPWDMYKIPARFRSGQDRLQEGWRIDQGADPVMQIVAPIGQVEGLLRSSLTDCTRACSAISRRTGAVQRRLRPIARHKRSRRQKD